MQPTRVVVRRIPGAIVEPEDVPPQPAGDRAAGIAARQVADHVVAVAAIQRIGALGIVQQVVAAAAGERIVAQVAVQRVRAIAAIQAVRAGAAAERVVAVVAGQQVVPAAADQRVRAAIAAQRVVVRPAAQVVVGVAAEQHLPHPLRAPALGDIGREHRRRGDVLQRHHVHQARPGAVMAELQHGVRARLEQPQEAGGERIGAAVPTGQIGGQVVAQVQHVAARAGLEIGDHVGVQRAGVVVGVVARRGADPEHILPGPAGQRAAGVAARHIVERVVARPAIQRIGALGVVEIVVAVAAGQRVRPGAAVQRIVALAAIQAVRPIAALEVVVAVAARQAVRPGIAIQRVVAAIARQRVVVRPAAESAVAVIAAGAAARRPQRVPALRDIGRGKRGRRNVLQRQHIGPARPGAVMAELQHGVRARLEQPQEAGGERIGAAVPARQVAGQVIAQVQHIPARAGLEIGDHVGVQRARIVVGVVAGRIAELEGILPGPAGQRAAGVAARHVGEDVVARPAIQRIGALGVVERIVAVAAGQRVRPGTAIQRVVALAAIQAVRPVAALEVVAAVAAREAVRPGIAVQRVVAAIARQRIGIRPAAEIIVPVIAAKAHAHPRRAPALGDIGREHRRRGDVLQRHHVHQARPGAVMAELQHGVRARLEQPQEAGGERIGAAVPTGQIGGQVVAQVQHVAARAGLEIGDHVGVQRAGVVVGVVARRGADPEHILPGPAGQRAAGVAARHIVERVVARPAIQRIGALGVVEIVVAVAAGQRVRPGAAVQRIVALAAVQAVRPALAVEVVVAFTAAQQVGAVAALQVVAAAAAIDAVIVRPAGEGVAEIVAGLRLPGRPLRVPCLRDVVVGKAAGRGGLEHHHIHPVPARRAVMVQLQHAVRAHLGDAQETGHERIGGGVPAGQVGGQVGTQVQHVPARPGLEIGDGVGLQRHRVVVGVLPRRVAEPEHILPRAAGQRAAGVAAGDIVERVVAVAAIQRIGAGGIVQVIRPRPAGQRVRAALAIQGVVIVPAIDAVVAIPAGQVVIARQPLDGIRPGCAGESVVTCCTGDRGYGHWRFPRLASTIRA